MRNCGREVQSLFGPLSKVIYPLLLILSAGNLSCDNSPATAVEAPRALTIRNAGALHGATFRIGDTLNVLFEADTLQINHVSVFLSFNAGRNWTLISDDESLSLWSDDWGDFAWVIPEKIRRYDPVLLQDIDVSTISDSCAVRIEKYDGASDPDFVTQTPGVFRIVR